MNDTGPVLSEPRKARWRFPLVCLLAAAMAVFAFSTPLQAQEGPEYEYVDLIVPYEYDENQVAYRVRNIGTATATGVTVSFLLEDLQDKCFRLRPMTIGAHSPTDKRTENTTNQRFTWEVGTVLPGETSLGLRFSTVAPHQSAGHMGPVTP